MSRDIFEIINPTNTLGVCRPLAHILGACETIVYNALLSKFRYYQKNDMLDDGWFYSTIPDLFESTSFSAFKQKRCITTLESFGLIETKNRGLPARRSFRIINNPELVEKLVAKGEEIMRTAKIEAALSYEKKRKHSDEPDNSESCFTDEEEETVFNEDAASAENIEESENSNPCSEETEQQPSPDIWTIYCYSSVCNGGYNSARKVVCRPRRCYHRSISARHNGCRSRCFHRGSPRT